MREPYPLKQAAEAAPQTTRHPVKFRWRPIFVLPGFFGLFFLYYGLAVLWSIGYFREWEHLLTAGYIAVGILCLGGAALVASPVRMFADAISTDNQTLWALHALISIILALTMFSIALDTKKVDGLTLEIAVASLTLAYQIFGAVLWWGFSKPLQKNDEDECHV